MQAKARAFLKALASGRSVAGAADEAGVTRSTVYRWRHNNPDFAQGWVDALDASADLLEDEARRRAVEGVEEVVYYGGKAIGVVRKYSDSLLMMLLKGRRPEIFRDRTSGDTNGSDGIGVTLSETERQARVEALLSNAEDRLKQQS